MEKISPDFPPLPPQAIQQTKTNCYAIPPNLKAWTLSLVIDFRTIAAFTHTLATRQEHDLVMKKCPEEKINLGLDLETCPKSLVIDSW